MGVPYKAMLEHLSGLVRLQYNLFGRTLIAKTRGLRFVCTYSKVHIVPGPRPKLNKHNPRCRAWVLLCLCAKQTAGGSRRHDLVGLRRAIVHVRTACGVPFAACTDKATGAGAVLP